MTFTPELCPTLMLATAGLDRNAAEDITEGARPDPKNMTFEQTITELVRGFSEQVAVVDASWTLLAVNDAWKQMIHVAGYPELVPGTNYRHFLETFASRGHANALAVLNGVNAIDAGETNSFQFTYAGVDKWEGRTLQLIINRLHVEGRTVATITRADVTDSANLRRLREQFSSSVLECQAEERRRFGRELHDSTAQLLASAGLLLGALKQKSPGAETIGVVEQLQELVSEAQKEIRSVSYLAHPPSLDIMGFAEAMQELAKGFAKRTGLHMSFEQRGDLIDLSRVSKSALYRLAQEALANVHRHAKAEHVCVCLHSRKLAAHMVITDDGIGISPQTLAGRGRAGVGLSGMRSRLQEIGGRLSVRRLAPGTAICASVPIHQGTPGS